MAAARCGVAALLAWARDQGIEVHKGIEIRSTADRGLGVFATLPIESGEQILSVPSSVLLSPARAAVAGPSLPTVRDHIAALTEAGVALRLTDELALTALLLRRERGWWSPWVDCLPSTFDGTLVWSEAELRELQASPVVEWTRKRNASVTATLEQLQRTWEPTRSAPPSRAEWEWALGAVWSRSFGAPQRAGGGSAPLLAPLVGMFNSAQRPVDATAAAAFEPRAGRFLVSAAAAVRAGDELLLLYGAGKGSAELAMDYGFAHAASHAAADAPPPPPDPTVLPLRASALLEHWRRASSATAEAAAAATGRLRALGGADEHPLTLAADLAASPGLAGLVAAARAVCGCSSAEAAALLGGFGAAELARYATSAAEDAALLATAEARRRTALAVRLAEKHVLQRLVSVCSALAANAGAGSGGRSGSRDEL